MFLIMSLFVLYSVKNVETATSEFSGLGVTAIPAILLTLFTGFIGWLMGFINEKKTDGSILHGW